MLSKPAAAPPPPAATRPAPLMRWLRAWVQGGVPAVAAFQAACGVVRGRGATNAPLDALFRVYAALGDEVFYITFLPFVLWEVDAALGRQLIITWGASMFAGQLAKDLLQLPRPPPDAVVQLESHYAQEYGMPSTHAMMAVAIPGVVVYEALLAGGGPGGGPRFTGSAPALLLAAASWLVLTPLSRLYLGVHTPADLVVGLALGAAAVAAHVAVGAAVDAAVLTSPHTPALVFAALVAAVLAYPRPAHPRWVSSPGDTTIVLGCVAGVLVGCWARAGVHLASLHAPFSGPAGLLALAACAPRVLLGFGTLVGVRGVVKALAQPACAWLAGPAFATRGALDAGHRMHGSGGGGGAPLPPPAAQQQQQRPPAASSSSRQPPGASSAAPPPQPVAPLRLDALAAASEPSTSSSSSSSSSSLRQHAAPPPLDSPSVASVGSLASSQTLVTSRSSWRGGVGRGGAEGGSSVASSASAHSSRSPPQSRSPSPPLPSSSSAASPAASASRRFAKEGSSSGSSSQHLHAAHAKEAACGFAVGSGAAGPPAAANSAAGTDAELLPVPLKQRYEVELPTKALTYAAVGFAALYVFPVAMRGLGWPVGVEAHFT